MERRLFLGINQAINENQLLISIVQILAYEEKDTFIVLHFHYGEIVKLKEYILQLFEGKFVDGKQFKNIVCKAVEELGFDVQDLLKPQFTKSFGPGVVELQKSL